MSAQPAVAVVATHPYYRPRRALGDPAPLACTVAKAALEAVMGGDGLEKLVRWIEPDLRDRLLRQYSLARRAGRRGATARILRIRVCRVTARAAEVSIVAQACGRSHAIAMRMEDVAGRWLTTELEVL